MIYNKHYEKTFKKLIDISDTICTITLEKLPSQTVSSIFRIKGVPSRSAYTDSRTETNLSSVIFYKQDLQDAIAINDGSSFPINDMSNRILKIRINGRNYTLDGKQINFNNNIISLSIISSI